MANNNSKTFGYCRISSKQQNEDRQVEAMLALGINERDIYVDKASGKDFDRQKYQALKQVLRAGDTIIIKSIDRLGRNYDCIKNEWNDLVNNIGVDIEVIDMPVLNTTNKETALMGKVITDVVLTLLGYVAEQERTFIKQRQAEGIKIAKEKGKRLGKPPIKYPDNWAEIYKIWKSGAITARKAMQMMNLKPTSFYKLAKNYVAV